MVAPQAVLPVCRHAARLCAAATPRRGGRGGVVDVRSAARCHVSGTVSYQRHNVLAATGAVDIVPLPAAVQDVPSSPAAIGGRRGPLGGADPVAAAPFYRQTTMTILHARLFRSALYNWPAKIEHWPADFQSSNKYLKTRPSFALCLVLPVKTPLKSAGKCSILAGQL